MVVGVWVGSRGQGGEGGFGVWGGLGFGIWQQGEVLV
jgi:hypothetical protein